MLYISFQVYWWANKEWMKENISLCKKVCGVGLFCSKMCIMTVYYEIFLKQRLILRLLNKGTCFYKQKTYYSKHCSSVMIFQTKESFSRSINSIYIYKTNINIPIKYIARWLITLSAITSIKLMHKYTYHMQTCIWNM